MLPLRTWVKRGINRVGRTFLPSVSKTGARCLLYHTIVPVEQPDPGQRTTPVRLFEQQMAFLAQREYRIISAGELVQQIRAGIMPPEKTVCLTFDDGEASLHELAFPILQRYRFPFTIFLIAERQGTSPFLKWEEIRRMQASGLAEFGCHGASHRPLRGLPEGDLRHETAQAKRRIEEEIRREVSLFAYPYGVWDNEAVAAVRRAGFRGSFTTIFGLNRPDVDPYRLKRSRVSWFDVPSQFECLLAGACDWYAGLQHLQEAASTSFRRVRIR